MYHMYVCVSESESEREELNCILGHSKKKKKGGGVIGVSFGIGVIK